MIKAGIIERAFELARSGQFDTVNAVVSRLKCEDYDLVAQHLAGRVITRQLKTIIASSRVSETSAAD
jgi:hypothetical protein